MDSDEAFRRFSKAVETDPFDVLLARWRRSAFAARLRKLPGVVQVIYSGSLARGTYAGKIHDVDLIVVFDQAQHPDWGDTGASAQTALGHLATGIDRRLGAGQGPLTRLAYNSQLRDHVVRCQDVSLGPFDGIIPSAPPVDVMPALRVGSHLRVPHRRKNTWEDTDPEKLIRLVTERKREWKYFDEVVRMAKYWAKRHHLNISSLAVEVLVIRYCPRPRFFETLSCGEAVARFFEAAAKANIRKLTDPAGRCGEIQPGMDYGSLRKALGEAADLSRKAVQAERAMENPLLGDRSLDHPNSYWRKIFGTKYPYARKYFWQPQYYEPFSWTMNSPDPGNSQASRDAGRAGHFGETGRPWYPPPSEGPPTSPPDSPPYDPDAGPPGGGGPRPGGTGPRRGPRSRPPQPAQSSADPWEEYFGRHGVLIPPPVTFG